MEIRTIFFDLDDTLYPSSAGLWEAIGKRMDSYMHTRIGLPLDEVARLRKYYYETCGTTLMGLQRDYHIEADEFLAYVHDLPLHEYLRPDPELERILRSLSQSLWVFTNADEDHASGVLDALGIAGCFHGIIDVRATQFHPKPHPTAFQFALQLAGESNPSHCLLLDDAPRNLSAADQLGFVTAIVGPTSSAPFADFHMLRIHDLPRTLPALWGPAADGREG